MTMRKRSEHFYEFGPFRIDVLQRALFRAGEPIALTSKAFDTLLVLARNRGRIVEKDELMAAVWPDTVVEENNLNQSISAVRRALGEDLEGKSYIQTIPRRGYRFTAEVKEAWETPRSQGRLAKHGSNGETESSGQAAGIVPATVNGERSITQAPTGAHPSGAQTLLHGNIVTVAPARVAAGRLSLRGRWVPAAGVFAVLGLALPWAIFVRRPDARYAARHEAHVRPGIPSLAQGKFLAVLPFRVTGDESALEYVAEGLAGTISARLFDVRGLHVAAAPDVDRAEKAANAQKTARQLGSNLLLEGVVEGTPERMRVSVNLDDVADGRRLWTGEFAGTSRDILALGDEVCSRVAKVLEIDPGDLQSARATPRPTENIDAYDLYLRGKNAMRRPQDLKNVEAAIHLQEEALKKDPGFALAYAGLADACLEMYRGKKDSFWSEKAVLAAQRARRLDAGLAEVHFVLGSVYEAIGNADDAIAEEKHGLALAPNSDEGYRRLANAYLAKGQRVEALRAYQKATEINPYYWRNFNVLGTAYFEMGDSNEALEAFRRVTELEPENAYGYDNIGAVYIRQGKWNDAIPVYERAIQLQPNFEAYSNLGMAYFCLKRYVEATKMFEKAAALNPNQQLVLGNLADSYRWSGQSRKAKETYDRAIALAYKELEVNPRQAEALESLALYYAKKGDAAQAQHFIRQARSIDPDNVQFLYAEAEIMALAGHPDRALAALQQAFQKGYPPEEAMIDPELGSVRPDPQFAVLVQAAKTTKF